MMLLGSSVGEPGTVSEPRKTESDGFASSFGGVVGLASWTGLTVDLVEVVEERRRRIGDRRVRHLGDLDLRAVRDLQIRDVEDVLELRLRRVPGLREDVRQKRRTRTRSGSTAGCPPR